MIEKVSIKNYKSIHSLPDFELKPVNVLIGANNSGKSNFLDVFAFLRDTLLEDGFANAQGNKLSGWRGALERRGGGESVCFNNTQQFELKCLSHSIKYSLEIGLGQAFLGHNYQILNEEISDESSAKYLLVVKMDQSFFMMKKDKSILLHLRRLTERI